MVVKYSIERNLQNLHPKEFVSVPIIPFQTWVDGFNMSFYATRQSCKIANEDVYYIGSNSITTKDDFQIQLRHYKRHLPRCSCDSYDYYVECISKIWTVEMNFNNWMMS